MVRVSNDYSNHLLGSIKKGVTIFTHDSYWDLIACILSLFNNSNQSCIKPRQVIISNKLINIRLHPSLMKARL